MKRSLLEKLVSGTDLKSGELQSALTSGLDAPVGAGARSLAETLARGFGPATVALLHYGSHATSSDARPESAHDFLAIVDGYGSAYRSLASTLGTHYSAIRASTLNRFLAPNVIAVADRSTTPPLLAKVAVFSLADFQRASSLQALDHFVLGRLFQPVGLVWTRDSASRSVVERCVLQARAASFWWARPYLPNQFDVETYCRVVLSTSFGAEIRPEHMDRVTALLAAQRTAILPMYAALLAWLAREGGVLVQAKMEAGRVVYADRRPPGGWGRFRSSLYFRRSKLRATLRWVKYIALYENWLDYVLQKVARRSGVAIDLSPRERRWPLIFLWPKAIRFLRSRPQRQD